MDRVAKAISESCQKRPMGFAKGRESKGCGGVYVSVFSYPTGCGERNTGNKPGILHSRPAST